MSYVVLARKWRPQTFADLTGQEHIARTLTNAIDRERVPHAMLFTGARGVGKTSSARIVAMALNCAEGPTPTPCGVCSACTEIQRSQSVDVLEIDGASNRGISEIRELRESVRYAPQHGRFKVYIIDEVHMLTTEAFNALLKTLEEPPPHVVFIFATTEVQKIPVTILSRCQRFDFRRIRHQAIIDRLRHIADSEGLAIDEDVLALVARQAAGGMRDALSLLDQLIAFSSERLDLATAAEILGAADRRRLFDMSAAIIDRDVDLALRSLDGVLEHGLDTTHFATEFVTHLRDLAIVAVAREPGQLTALSESELALCSEQAARTTPDVLQRAFEIMVSEAEAISRSPWPRLVFEMALVKLCSLESLQPIDTLIDRLEAFAAGGKTPSGSGGVPGGGRSSEGRGASKPTPAPSGASPRARTPHPSTGDAPAPSSASPTRSETATRTNVPDVAVKDDASPAPAGAVSADKTDAAPSNTAAHAETDVAPSNSAAHAETDVAPSNTAVHAETDAAPSDTAGHAETDAAPSDRVTHAETDAAPSDRVTHAETDAAPSDRVTHAEEASGRAPPERRSVDTDDAPSAPLTERKATQELLERPLSFEEWRTMIRELDAEGGSRGRMLARARVHFGTHGHIRVGLHAQLAARLSPDATAELAERLARIAGGRVTLDVVAMNDMSDEERSASRQLSELEELEAAERRRELQERMSRHPAVHLLRERWPEAEIRVRVSEATQVP